MVASALKTGLERWRQRSPSLGSLPPSLTKSLAPLLILAIGITALVMLVMWNNQANYKPIFGATEKVSATDMMAVLEAEQIPYRLHPESGQVLVPTDDLGKVRMLLAAKGVTAQLPAGLEIMDRNDPLGVSQFVQDVRFKRGLEGELAQSISSLNAIASARVHLSIAKTSSFVVSQGSPSSASVAIKLKPGHQLNTEQIAAIIKLVSGSVSGLSPQNVSLVDQAGQLLSSRIDLSEGVDALQAIGSDAAKRHQEATLRNAHELLAPVLGANNFKISVTAEVDNDRVEETREQYGEAPKVTSEAIRDERDIDRIALGVPGSLSNRPVAVADNANNNNDNVARKNASTRQYAYDRHVTQIKRSRGRLTKLSVAVVLNNTGRAQAWSATEMAQVEKLLSSGLGIDTERGDQLTVSAMPFPAAAPAEPWWQERDTLIDVGTNVFYLIAAVLAFFLVIRPLMRLLSQRIKTVATPAIASSTSTLPAPAAMALPDATATASGTAPEAAAQQTTAQPSMTSVVPLMENYDLPPAGSPVDVMVDHLKVLASKEPERVAEVVKQWVQKHGRTE